MNEAAAFPSRSGERGRAIPRADIWMYRRTGSVCRKKPSATCGLLPNITVDLIRRIGELLDIPP
jgi:hypothetical protein